MKKMVFLILCTALFLTSCVLDTPLEAEFFAMDTLIQLRIWGNEDHLNEATSLLTEMDRSLNAHCEHGEIYALNRDKLAELRPYTDELLRASVKYSQITDGAFDPTIFPVIEQWTSATTEPPDPCLESVGWKNITFDNHTAVLQNGASVDLGGIAKGFAAQKTAESLRSLGVKAAVLSLGGNVQTIGYKPDGNKWAIGLANPDAPTEHIAIIEFDGSMSVVTSGGYQRYFDIAGQRYPHILDPKTGYPVENTIASVTILSQNGTMADAYSTALFVMGFEKAVEFWRGQTDFEVVFILKDGAIHATQGAALMLKECDFTIITR